METRHEILNYLHQQEPDAIIGLTLFIEVQQCFSDWCLDLAEELEIEDEVDVANAIDELEQVGILSLNMADPGDDYICNLEFRQPLNPNQLLIPFTEFIQGSSHANLSARDRRAGAQGRDVPTPPVRQREPRNQRLSLRKHAQKPNRPLCRRRSDRRTQPVRSPSGARDLKTTRTLI